MKNKLANLNADDPLNYALHLARSCKTPSMKIIQAALNSNVDIVELVKITQKEKVTSSTSSKHITYKVYHRTYISSLQDFVYHHVG